MATLLARVRDLCLGAMLLTGCIKLDRTIPNAPETGDATSGDVTLTDSGAADVEDVDDIVDGVEVVETDVVQIEATIIGQDTATSVDADDTTQADSVQIDGEVIGTEVIVADTQPPDGSEVTACGDDQCIIDGVCREKGATSPPGSAGQICDPLCSLTEWVPDCGALACLKDPYCDGGNCYAADQEDMEHACFVAGANRCYTASEQTEGDDWRDEPFDDSDEPWPSLARNTPHEASLNPLGGDPNGDAGDIDWVRWDVTRDPSAVAAGLSPMASARIANYTGVHVELCVLVSCGEAPFAKPLTMECPDGATRFARVDATRDGCCVKVSPETDKRARAVWALATCLPGVTQQVGFARVEAPAQNDGNCGQYELAFDLDNQNLTTP